jgi:hypothetical protein
VTRKLDNKISTLASVVKELELGKADAQRVATLVTESSTIPQVLARAEKRQYPIGVSNIPNSDQIVDALVARGYSASVLQTGVEVIQRAPEEYQGIWIDSTVPYDFAIDVIKTAINFYPQLKYMFIVGDIETPHWQRTTNNKLFLGARTAWATSLGLKPLPNGFLSSLFAVKSQEAFNALIRSYYGEPPKKE